MKTLFYTLALLALPCIPVRTAAQTGQTGQTRQNALTGQTPPTAQARQTGPTRQTARTAQALRTDSPVQTAGTDSVLLSQTTRGDYLVQRFLVVRADDSAYSVRYRIDQARLSSLFAGNGRELDSLNAFIDRIARDSLVQVRSIVVTGYASPDGSAAYNETLARNRARDFAGYLDRELGLADRYDVRTEWIAEDWRDARALVARSSMPDRQAVLDILDGTLSRQAKEQRLKAMPRAWEYLKTQILPQQRRVELVVDYVEGNIVEQRTLIAPPPAVTIVEPCPEPVREALDQYYVAADDQITGIIFELPGPGTDYEWELREAEREVRALEAAADQRRMARIREREIRRAERAQLREARRMEREARRQVR